MEDNAAKYYVLDGTVKDASVDSVDVDNAQGRAAYEVIRFINGIPVFFDDHIERMKGTFEAVGQPLEMELGQLKKDIKTLLEINNAKNCNVKIVVTFGTDIGNNGVGDGNGRVSVNPGFAGKMRLIYISKSFYPPKEMADEGVKTGLLRIERQNPNAKLVNKAYKDAVSKKIRDDGLFEAILVDSRGRITEGSKSNVFFVKNGSVFTAPGEFVLMGITRKYVFEACKNAGFEVIEQFVGARDLNRVEGAFLSGTSINVLPIKSVDDIVINSSSHPVIAAVRQEYEKLLEKHIEIYSKIW